MVTLIFSEEVIKGRLDEGVQVQGLVQIGKLLGKRQVEVAGQEGEWSQEVVTAIVL